MGTIIAIGGGDLSAGATLSIDREIVQRTGKKRPRALFIPTASLDREGYCEAFEAIYGDRLGCITEMLLLFRERPGVREVRACIDGADLIYVGGGNTLRMMKLWRKLGVDRLLKRAHKQGTVLAGLSAGAVCWFESGCSDSRKFSSPDDWDFICVRGLGLLRGVCCPHYHREQREKPFSDIISKRGGLGIALDDHCALEVTDEKYRMLTSRDGAPGYRVFRGTKDASVVRLPAEKKWRPLSELYQNARLEVH